MPTAYMYVVFAISFMGTCTPELQGHKTIISQGGGVWGGGSQAPQDHPVATP